MVYPQYTVAASCTSNNSYVTFIPLSLSFLICKVEMIITT